MRLLKRKGSDYMTLNEVRKTVYNTVKGFFKGASVVWAEQSMTSPTFPFVTIKMRDLQRSLHALADDEGDRSYDCSIPVEINLYTKGRERTNAEGTFANYENTAVSDLNEFFKYADSDIIQDELAEKGIAIVLNPPVRDLTDLQNDSRYRYRAMAEATVTFIDSADGLYGLAEMDEAPNPSGGGTEEMKEAPSDYIEDVDIEETEEL